MNKRRTGGFTLIELSLVVVLIGIITTISILRYRDYTTSSKLREPAYLLKKMWEMCYVYYMTNAISITDNGIPLYYGFNTGNEALDKDNLKRLNSIGLDQPQGRMLFWFVSTEEAICYAFPKKTSDPFAFAEVEIDANLVDYEMAIDNDGRIYLYTKGVATDFGN